MTTITTITTITNTMHRFFRHRLHIIGIIALIVGMVHLGIFFNQTNKGDYSQGLGFLSKSDRTHKTIKRDRLPVGLHYYVKNDDDIIVNNDDINSKHAELIRFRILENKIDDTTKQSIDYSAKEGIIQNQAGDLLVNEFSEPAKATTDTYQYNFPPHVLRVSPIQDKKLLNETYFHLSPTILNELPKRIVLHNPNLCSLRGGKPPYLLVLVPTVVNHVFERKTIRETWGSVAYNGGQWGASTMKEPVRVLFILGSHNFSELDTSVVKQEAEEHGDLLLSDFVDSYRNLSLKIAVGLAWSNQYCHGVNHVAKVDEDTFLFVPKLLSLLQRADIQYKQYVLGFPHISPAPSVLRRGKWAVDEKLYPYESYPRYVYGHSYVISGHAVKPILSAYFRMPFVTNEDAFFTGILPVTTDIVRLGHRSFAFLLRHETECDVMKGFYVSLTKCCNIHHTSIFKAILNNTCNTYKLRDISEPKCKFGKMKH